MRDELRARVVAAIATGVAIAGCKGGEGPDGGAVTVPAQPAAVETATASASASASAPASASASASATASASASASAPASASASAAASAPRRPTTCESGTKKQDHCFTAFQSPGHGKSNPTRTYDKKGCLPDNEVAESCSGITGVISGPTKQGNKCCYVVCQGLVPPCGRPLVADDGTARIARIAAAGAIPARDAWLADAAMEHASIFSFARFVLELEAIGAPARFVDDARRAGLDEIEHTRLCLHMATRCDPNGSAFAAAEIALDGISIRTDLAAIAVSAAEEACVGETYSALSAAWRAEDEADPVARDVLGRIAQDEARHAELGWAFVSWAIAHGGESGASIARAVGDAIDRSLAMLGDTPAAGDVRAIVRDAARLVARVDTRARASLDRSRSHGEESLCV